MKQNDNERIIITPQFYIVDKVKFLFKNNNNNNSVCVLGI